MSRVSLEERIENKRRTVKGHLTGQEHKVLLMVAEGYADQEIADWLGVAAGTVRTIMQRIRERLEARNRIHCIHIAHQLGLFENQLTKAGRPVKAEAKKRHPVRDRGQLFEKAGMTYRPKNQESAPPVEPTHFLAAVHPSDSDKSWEIDLSVADDVEARRRMNQLAGWIYPPFRIALRRAASDGREIASVPAWRVMSPDD